MPYEKHGCERLGIRRPVFDGVYEKPNNDIIRIAVEFVLCKKSHPVIELPGSYQREQYSSDDLQNAIDGFEDKTNIEDHSNCISSVQRIASSERWPLHDFHTQKGLLIGLVNTTGHRFEMLGRNHSLPQTVATNPSSWRKKLAVLLACIVFAIATAYVTRRTLLLAVARTTLNNDSALVAQERADGIAIVFPSPPAPWIAPIKNQMNDIWDPIKSDGVNYYMFGGRARGSPLTASAPIRSLATTKRGWADT